MQGIKEIHTVIVYCKARTLLPWLPMLSVNYKLLSNNKEDISAQPLASPIQLQLHLLLLTPYVCLFSFSGFVRILPGLPSFVSFVHVTLRTENRFEVGNARGTDRQTDI